VTLVLAAAAPGAPGAAWTGQVSDGSRGPRRPLADLSCDLRDSAAPCAHLETLR
jgi:hypothetical protein